jgi:hypothetical protein
MKYRSTTLQTTTPAAVKSDKAAKPALDKSGKPIAVAAPEVDCFSQFAKAKLQVRVCFHECFVLLLTISTFSNYMGFFFVTLTVFFKCVFVSSGGQVDFR